MGHNQSIIHPVEKYGYGLHSLQYNTTIDNPA